MNVLIVDDSADDRLWLSRLASEVYPDAVIHEVVRAEQAIEALAHGDYDLVVSDQNLPGMSGTEFVRELRDGLNMIPVVIVSGRNSLDTATQTASVGATAFVSKDNLSPETLERGVDQSHALQLRYLDIESFDLDLASTAARLVPRIMAPFDGIRRDIREIRKRPNQSETNEQLEALDQLERETLRLEELARDAMRAFEAQLAN